MWWWSVFIYTMQMNFNWMLHPLLWIRIFDLKKKIQTKDIKVTVMHNSKIFRSRFAWVTCIYETPAVSERRNIETAGYHAQDVNQMENKSNALEAVNRWTRSWVDRAVKTYASVTLNSGDVFGCFALWGMNCFRMCAAVWCVSTGTAAAMHKPRTIIQFQFLILKMTGLKTNGTYYNRTIIHVNEWKHLKNPTVDSNDQQQKHMCSALMHLFIYFLCLNSLLCVFAFSREFRPSERSSKNIISTLASTLQKWAAHKLLPSSFAPEPALFQMRWMVSAVTCWSSCGWAVFSWLWGPQL